MTCPACGRADPLHPVMSVLDYRTRDLCGECIDHNCEPQGVVVEAMKAGRDLIPSEIWRSITVLDAGEYVTPAAWSKRARDRRRQRMTADEERREHELLSDTLAKIREINAPPPAPPKRGLFSFLSWRHA